MKYLNKTAALLLILLLGVTINATAENVRVPKIYAFGFAASFNDSTVYITDIQEINDVWVNDKSDFLLERESYSNQLKEYLLSKNQRNRTCIISYAFKRKDAEKKLLKMKKRYNAANHYDVRFIMPSEFSFKAVEPTRNLIEEKPLTKAEKKAQKKSQKKAVKDAKKAKKVERKENKKQAKKK